MSAPSGIASVTPQSQTVAAGTNLDLVAQRDTNQTSGRRWIHNVGQHLSLFVQGVKDKTSLKLFAAKGKIQLQAQSDSMEITADQDVHITSAKSQQLFNGKKEVLLTCCGAYIRIKDGKIELHAPGSVSFKGGLHDWSGGTKGPEYQYNFAEGKLSPDHNHRFEILHPETGKPMANVPYRIRIPGQDPIVGKTNAQGLTAHIPSEYISKDIIFEREIADFE